jgi:hypothetical protein
VQLPIATFVNSAGATQGFILADGKHWFYNITGWFAGMAFTTNQITANGGNLTLNAEAGFVVNVSNSGWKLGLKVDTSQNALFGALTAAGTSAAKVLQMGGSTMATAAFPADSAQLGVVDYAAGDARWNFMSELSLRKVIIGNGEVLIPDCGGIVLQPALTTDETFCAIEKIPAGTAGENLTFGSHCYLAADLKWYKCDSSTSATMPGSAIALGTINAAATGAFLKRGYIRKDSLWAGMTCGQDIYPSETAGLITQTAPVPSTTATVCLQTLGHATSTNTASVGIIYYDPSPNYQEIGVDVINFAAADGAIAPSDLSAIPMQYLGDHSSTQTFTLGAVVAADVGKMFDVVKTGTGAGVLRLQLPAGTYAYSAAGASTAAGYVELAVSARGSMRWRVTSATSIQLVCLDGTIAFSS